MQMELVMENTVLYRCEDGGSTKTEMIVLDNDLASDACVTETDVAGNETGIYSFWVHIHTIEHSGPCRASRMWK